MSWEQVPIGPDLMEETRQPVEHLIVGDFTTPDQEMSGTTEGGVYDYEAEEAAENPSPPEGHVDRSGLIRLQHDGLFPRFYALRRDIRQGEEGTGYLAAQEITRAPTAKALLRNILRGLFGHGRS